MEFHVIHPSVDLVELNNLVVTLRKTTKQAKLFVFRQLTKKIKKLDKKFDKSKNEKKMKTINEELKKLKLWNIDRITKAVLANELNLAQAGSVRNVDALLVARIAEVPVMKIKVKNFREKYPDWKDLVAYLMYKNSSGKFKKNKTKKLGPDLHIDETLSDMESMHDDSDSPEEIEAENFAVISKLSETGQKSMDVDELIKEEDDQDTTISVKNSAVERTKEESYTTNEQDIEPEDSDLEMKHNLKKILVKDHEKKGKKDTTFNLSKKRKKGHSDSTDDFFVTEHDPINIESKEEDETEYQDEFFCSVENYNKFRKKTPLKKDLPQCSVSESIPVTTTSNTCIKKQNKIIATDSNFHNSNKLVKGFKDKSHDKGGFFEERRNTAEKPFKKKISDTCKTEAFEHPSWAAKKREKEKLMNVKSNPASKIVFYDSD